MRQRLGGSQFEASLDKKFVRPPSQPIKAEQELFSHLLRKHNKEVHGAGWTGHKHEILFKNERARDMA
jgi:hypothetical protein